MRAFIDESGPFTSKRDDVNLCGVGALAVPDRFMPSLRRRFEA